MARRIAILALGVALAGCTAPTPQPTAPLPPAPAADPPGVTAVHVPGPARERSTPVETKPQTATLTVTVKGVGPEPSRLLIGLFDEARYKTRKPPFNRDGPAKAPETVAVFEGLTPGRYAVKTMQDLNGNDDMDKTLLGFPKEPFGFSNDVKPVASEPSFRQTSFEVVPGANAITIHLQRM